MQYLRVLFALLSAIASTTALPSANSAALAPPAPHLDQFFEEVEFEDHHIPQPRHVVKPPNAIIYPRQTSLLNTTAPAPNATVQLCTLPHFQGSCSNPTWPVNTCISLNGYAGLVQSLQPIRGYQCLLAQARCNVAMPYISIGSEASDTKGEDLSVLPWIEKANSYICFTEIEALQRFVRMRLRVSSREATGVGSRRADVQEGGRDVSRIRARRGWTWVGGVVDNLQREEAKVHGD